MSIQLQISAFDLSQLKKQLASKDKTLEKKAIAYFEELADEVGLEDEEITEGKERIQNLLKSKIGTTEEVETIAEVAAIMTLVENSAQSLEDDGDMEWPWKELTEIDRQLQKRFDARTKLLFSFFVEGRNLVGRSFDDDAGFYLYLTKSEIEELRTGLEKVYATISEIVDSGAMNEQDFDSNMVDTLQTFTQTLEAVQSEE